MKIKCEIYIPKDTVEDLIEALNNTGALTIGNYDYCFSTSIVSGHYRPLKNAKPFEGEIEVISSVEEIKVEFRCDKKYINKVIEIIKEYHPYEEPVYNLFPLLNEEEGVLE